MRSSSLARLPWITVLLSATLLAQSRAVAQNPGSVASEMELPRVAQPPLLMPVQYRTPSFARHLDSAELDGAVNTLRAPLLSSEVVEEKTCDSDWDGALLGLAAGAAPGLVLCAIDGCESDGSEGRGTVLIVGTIAGLLTGLAVDSASC